MEKEISHKLVKETFESEFNELQFSKFIINILKKIDTDKKFQYQGAYIPEAFRPYIKSYERLATYTDPNGKEIDILTVNLTKDSSLERARTAQRNFVAHHLKNRDNKDAALVAFIAPESKEWRFSFIKMEYKFVQNESGGAKVEEEFTPARRWSFLVGEHENSHTAQSRFAPILQNDKNPKLKDLEECFDIEKVTKEFFEKYRELYLKFKDKLDEIVENNQNIKGDFDKKGVDTVEFAKKLLGQIVFLYFLQKKGWFGVERDKPWGTGPKNYLRKLFNDKGNDKNFFNNVLEPLFYEALALKRECNFYNAFNCKIPFLNGGLFDPINNYDWVHTDILLPDCLFSNKEKTAEGDIGTGILDVFDRYNFTVKEDEPLEREVAVDPEMLGKVFENLLDVKDRKSKGTYYTPREIVHYMCVQSLVNYLATELEGKVTKEECETLIKNGESVSENEVRVEENKKETATYSYKLPENIRNHAKLIDEKLANIKVCDPAIGSGAFPLGMMAEIVRTRLVLSSYMESDERRTPYNFKGHCIQNSLYGVDIDPGAIQIAKLRLWLSLVVDEDNFEEIRPLPNLDYKIMQGNSLLEEYDGVRLFDDALIIADNNKKGMELLTFNPKKQLKELREKFFRTTEKDKKEELKKKIDEKEWKLIDVCLKMQGKEDKLKEVKSLRERNVKPYFLWKLNFMEIFQEKGGFDVVIANPPYIDSENMVKKGLGKLRESILRTYKMTRGNWDIYIAFFELGFNILNNFGRLIFITPDKWISKPFGENLRISKISNILTILKAGRKIFENANVDSIISFFSNIPSTYLEIFEYNSIEFIYKLRLNKSSILYPYSLDYLFSDFRDLIQKIDSFNNKISFYGECENSCSTSDCYKLKSLINDIPENEFNYNIYLKIINTGTIDKFFPKWGICKMTYLNNKYLYPAVNRDEFLNNFNNTYGIKSVKPKIILKGLNLLDACLDEHGHIIPGKTTLIITSDNIINLKFLLAVLNTKISFFYIKEKYPSYSYNQGINFTKEMINNFPIPYINEYNKNNIINIVDNILDIGFPDTQKKIESIKEYKEQLNNIIMELYALSPEEVDIINKSVKR